MTGTIVQARSALGTIRTKFTRRIIGATGLKKDINGLKSSCAGIESGCRSDVMAINELVSNTRMGRIFIPAEKTEAARRKALDIMSTLSLAASQTDELIALLGTAGKAVGNIESQL